MKISELQELLEKVKDKEGDIVVTTYQWNDPACPAVITSVKVLSVKPDYIYRGKVETYTTLDNIKRGGIFHNGAYEKGYTKTLMKRLTERVVQIMYRA